MLRVVFRPLSLTMGSERNGFITFNDIHRRYYNKKTKNDGKRLRIQDAIAPGAELLVQVYKEEVGNKGAALTTDITLPGRYLVLMPFSDSGGVSRKIESESVRKKLKEIVNKLNVPDQMGLIVRTAGRIERRPNSSKTTNRSHAAGATVKRDTSS